MFQAMTSTMIDPFKTWDYRQRLAFRELNGNEWRGSRQIQYDSHSKWLLWMHIKMRRWYPRTNRKPLYRYSCSNMLRNNIDTIHRVWIENDRMMRDHSDLYDYATTNLNIRVWDFLQHDGSSGKPFLGKDVCQWMEGIEYSWYNDMDNGWTRVFINKVVTTCPFIEAWRYQSRVVHII